VSEINAGRKLGRVNDEGSAVSGGSAMSELYAGATPGCYSTDWGKHGRSAVCLNRQDFALEETSTLPTIRMGRSS